MKEVTVHYICKYIICRILHHSKESHVDTAQRELTSPNLSRFWYWKSESYAQLSDGETKKLNDMESVVVLMFDEIYDFSWQTLTFHPTLFTGWHPTKMNLQRQFMIKSLSAKYSDVVGFFPLCGFSVEILSKVFKNIMSLVIDCGFDCVCAIADNHPINNPCDSERRLFLMIDPTHNLKNVFNIFQKRQCTLV